MACTIREAMVAFEAGKQHWRDVAADKIEPKIPQKYIDCDRGLRMMFVRGAVEEMEVHDVSR